MTDSNSIISAEQRYGQTDRNIYDTVPIEYQNILWEDRRQDDSGDIIVDLEHLPGYPPGMWCPWVDVIAGYLPSLPREDWE